MKRFPLSRSLYLLALLFPVAFGACNGDSEEEELPFGLTSEIITSGDHVSDIVFAPDGRMFFAEQFTGSVRVMSVDGVVQEQPFVQLDVANWLDLDWGLTGLALDPNFDSNGYVYVFYTEPIAAPAGAAQPTASPVAAPTPAPATTAAGAPPPIQTAPGQTAPPAETTAPAQPAQSQNNPLGRPVLARFTDRNGVGEDFAVISNTFPITEQIHAGYNANGNIHFGPDGMLYVSLGDYDFATDPVAQDLSSPIGKLLRVNPATGAAPADNPFAADVGADPRVFAYGFRDPFDFVFHPESEAVFGTDNTPYTCEELNIIRGAQNYGWPNVGVFPFSDCSAGEQVEPIYHFAREGMQPGDFVSLVEITGLTFTPADRYPAMGESLFVCEGQRSVVEGVESPGVLRRLALGADFASVASDDLIVRDCKGDVEAAPDGTLYYANATEIRRLLPGATTGATSSAVPSR